MTQSKLLIITLCILLAGLVFAQAEPTEQATPDRELSLSKTSVFEVATPDPVVENQSAPGERPTLARVHPVAPPTVSHGVADWLPITLESNLCIDCHQVDEKEEGEATPIPPSHFTDLRHELGHVGEKVVGARYNCIACHVALTESEILVKNRFKIPQNR